MPGTSFSTAIWSGYDEQSVTNPGSALTDFTLLINIANLSSDWKSNVQSDGADIRLTKGDGTTELAYDLIDWAYNAGSPTGWIRVKWSGTLAASGTQNVRVWVGYTGGTATAYDASETYGSDSAYDAFWKAYWASISVADRTSNGNNITNTTGVGTSSDAKVGDGSFDYERGSADYMQMSSAVVPAYPFTMMCWIKTESFPSSGAVGLMAIETNGSNDHRHALYTGTTSSQNVGANSRSTSAGNAVSSTTMSTGTWYHASGVWTSAASRTARTNAAGAIENTTSISPSGINYTRLGRFNNSPVYYFDGLMNDVQIHSTARSADWIDEEYNQTDDNATFWGTWAWTESASSVSATAALSIAGATISASGTHTPPTFTASVAADIAGATIAAAGTHTAPTFTASVAATIAGATIAASGTHTTPTYTATVAADIAGATISASGTHTAPTFTASVAASIAGATIAASGTHTAPTYTTTTALANGGSVIAATGSFNTVVSTASVAATIAGAAIAASSTHTAPTYTATTALANGETVIAASGSFAAGTATATVAVAISGSTIAGAGAVDNPTYSATAAMSCGAAQISTIATFAEVGTALVETFAGVRYFEVFAGLRETESHADARYFETFVSARNP